METETWIGRVLINQLTTHDKRYKHNYASVEQTTDDLVAACTQLDALITAGGFEELSLEQLLSQDAAFECEVETELQTLEGRELIECVGEQKRLGPPLEPGDYGITAVWEPTESGRAEARAIREAYAAEVEALVETHGRESDEFKEEILALAKTYGILPNLG